MALTARDDEAGCRRIAAAGFHRHLVKPVEPSDLVEVIASLFQEGAEPVR